MRRGELLFNLGYLFGPMAIVVSFSTLLCVSRACRSSARRQQEEHYQQLMRDQFGGSSLTMFTLANFEELTDNPANATKVESIDVMTWSDVSDPKWGLLKKLPNLKRLHFYDCGNIDPVLNNIRGMDSLERVILTGLTPCSKAGMACLPSFPNLKELVVCAGVTDAGLAHLRGHPSLEELTLIGSDVTDDGLAVLKDVPSLRRLVIAHRSRDETRLIDGQLVNVPGLTDAAVEHLKCLTSLAYLELDGDWISSEKVEELREALPGCEVQASEGYVD